MTSTNVQYVDLMSDYNLGLSYVKINQIEKAINCFKRAHEARLKLHDPNHSDIAEVLFQIGICHDKLDDFEQAIDYKIKAYLIRKNLYEAHPEICETLLSIGKSYAMMNDNQSYNEAIRYFNLTLEAYEALNTSNIYKNHPDIADAYHALGEIYYKKNDFQIALKCLDKALEIKRAVFDPSHFSIGDTLYAIGLAHYRLKDYKQSLEYIKNAYDIADEVYGEMNKKTACFLNMLGVCHDKLGDPKRALELELKAYEIRKSLFRNTDHLDLVESINSIADCYDNLGDLHKAHEFKMNSLEMTKNLYKENHISKALAMDNLAISHKKLGNFEKALKLFEDSYEMKQQIYLGNHVEIANSLHNLGIIHEKMGDLQKAEQFYQRSYDMRKSIFDSDHLDLATSQTSLGFCYYKMGQYKEALSLSEKALNMKRDLFPGNHEEVAISLYNIGLIYEKLGNKKCISYFNEAFEMRKFLVNEYRFAIKKIIGDFTYENRHMFRTRINLKPKSLDNFELSTSRTKSAPKLIPITPFENPVKIQENFHEKSSNNQMEDLNHEVNSFSLNNRKTSSRNSSAADYNKTELPTITDKRPFADANKLNLSSSANDLHQTTNQRRNSPLILKNDQLRQFTPISINPNISDDSINKKILDNSSLSNESSEILTIKNNTKKENIVPNKSDHTLPRLTKPPSSRRNGKFKSLIPVRDSSSKNLNNKSYSNKSRITPELEKQEKFLPNQFQGAKNNTSNIDNLKDINQNDQTLESEKISILGGNLETENHSPKLIQVNLTKEKRSPENLENWTHKEVRNWLMQKQINEDIIYSLLSHHINGKTLYQFYKMSKEDPDIFHQTLVVGSSFRVDSEQISKFKESLEKLFEQ